MQMIVVTRRFVVMEIRPETTAVFVIAFVFASLNLFLDQRQSPFIPFSSGQPAGR